jgi:hypothetical protein
MTMTIPDTNQVQQAFDTAAAIHSQLSPYVPALAIAAGWAGREIRNFNAWLLAVSEYIIGHGGIGYILLKLFWNPPAKTALMLAMAVWACGCAAPTMTHGIPNLAIVEPGVYRGGQPTAEGWAWLESQGLTFDVKLNTWDEAREPKLFLNGIWVDSEPISLRHQLFGIDATTVNDAVETVAMRTPKNVVFIHCQHGQDRTGLIVGVYRVRFEHWPKDKAYKEMLAHGFHPALLGLKRYWDSMGE